MWTSLAFLLILSKGLVDSMVKRAVGLSEPDIKSVVVLDTAFVISWNTVESADGDNPIEGYKLNVWEVPDKTIYVFKTINGTKELVKETQPAKLFDKVPPEVKPKVYIVATDKNMTRVNGVKKHVVYQLRVQAFTKSEDGPLSPPTGLQIGGSANLPED